MNHSSNPNAQRVWADEECGTWVSIVATRDIGMDEEITHRYVNVSAYPHGGEFID
ncbi:SET domain-containing protein [Bradyrhizobium sp. LMG 9283]|uniref:SET domain-containing protein n=1 Tax=Bradyrhizobium sp. LMG 9283 TaxID=592064 RepID=UPI00388E8DEC